MASYVLCRNLDLGLAGDIGKHQFLLFVDEDAYTYASMLRLQSGNSGMGFEQLHPRKLKKGFAPCIVVGAHNSMPPRERAVEGKGHSQEKRLTVLFFQSADLGAAESFLSPAPLRGKLDLWSVQGSKIEISRRGIENMAQCTYAYIVNEIDCPIKYPGTLSQVNPRKSKKVVNSNSWCQSVIRYSGGRALTDFPGNDLHSTDLIDPSYFRLNCFSVCPVIPEGNRVSAGKQ